MASRLKEIVKGLLAPPHPTFRSRASRAMSMQFIQQTLQRDTSAMIVNLGSAWIRLHPKVINLDLFLAKEVDVQGDILALPFQDQSVDAVVCTGVLEHVSDAYVAAQELHRVLKAGGEAYIELPWMQGIHASPNDFQRWTPEGYKRLFQGFEIHEVRVAIGPASALAWMLQETLSMLLSFRTELLYKIGLRMFGWIVYPIAWLDIVLEQHPRSAAVASGFALRLKKPSI